ncbi:MAG: NAD(P)/FAD-dependent oxidoreductase [Culicoidibacterales bacterium]
MIYDITVIGAGPVGIFTAFYGGMREMNVLILDTLEAMGGQLAALYPDKYIYDIAGFPKIKAQDLIDNLTKQLDTFQATTTIQLKEQVTHVVKQADGSFEITTNLGSYQSRSIIITAGNGAFKPRPLGVVGEELAHNLHYFVRDLHIFADRDVIIFGGGDSAVDWALMLEPIAKSVALVHRRDEFRAHEHSVAKLKASTVTCYTPYIPSSLELENTTATHVSLTHVASKEVITIPVDDIIVNFGFVSSLGPISEWDLQLEKNQLPVDSFQATNIPGIFACGDICTYPGRNKLIITGFGEAPIAVAAAKKYAFPESTQAHAHSTSMFEKKN